MAVNVNPHIMFGRNGSCHPVDQGLRPVLIV